jgi:hypothetical protein
VEFAKQLLDDMPMQPFRFAEDCLRHDDVVSLQFVLGAVPGLDLEVVCRLAGFDKAIVCLRFLLERGVRWNNYSLLYPARDNRLDILELVLPHSKEWCPLVPTVAACLGYVRFLMRIFEAGCPTWACANDGEPHEFKGCCSLPEYYPVGQDESEPLKGRCLFVSSDLVVSGPVLLYAAQKGAPLTPRMEGILGEVRRRALALAGCFHMAARLARGPTKCARRWQGMGRVPTELVERIATLARISIVAVGLVE